MRFAKLIRLFIVSVIIAVVIHVLNRSFSSASYSLNNHIIYFTIAFMYASCITFVNTYFFDFVDRFYSWKTNPNKRLVIGALGSVFLTILTLFALNAITEIIIFNSTWSKFIKNQNWNDYYFGLAFTLFISLIFHAFYFYKELQGQRIKEQKVIATSATAQFDALKNQLDPHFLFNSLNVLVSLIEENPKAATKFTTSLSKVYRYVLEQRNKELVTIDEELSFARTYVSLLKMRFEDSITVTIPEQSSHPDLMVLPLSLQLLLENAIKHNIVSAAQPLHITIEEIDNNLVVTNSLQLKPNLLKSTGVGLQNIASRYKLLTKEQMVITESQKNFSVHLPILDKTTIQYFISSDIDEPVLDLKMLRAKDRVKAHKQLYDSIVSSAMIILLLATLNYFTSDFPWVIFPIVGMSISVIAQYIRLQNWNFPLSRHWEEKKIDALMNDPNF